MSNTSAQQSNSGSFCTVGCKLPNGLILELGKKGEERYESIQINGLNSAKIIGGHGITENVSRDFMDKWLKKHAWLPAVRKGFIFIEGDLASATAHAIDHQKERTGLERLNPADAPKGIEVDADHAKQSRADIEQLRAASAGA